MFAKISLIFIIAAACSSVATGRLNKTLLLENRAMSKKELTKRCSKCKQFKAHSEFYKAKKNKDGLQPECKKCHNQCVKRHHQQNRPEILQRKKQHYQTHKVQQRQYYKQYRKTTRGHLGTVWKNMLRRCNKPQCKVYKHYGGRGIKVKFISFDDFYDYVVKELKVDPRGLTIDRINNDGHYEKGNIRFITHKENCQNRQRKGA